MCVRSLYRWSFSRNRLYPVSRSLAAPSGCRWTHIHILSILNTHTLTHTGVASSWALPLPALMWVITDPYCSQSAHTHTHTHTERQKKTHVNACRFLPAPTRVWFPFTHYMENTGTRNEALLNSAAHTFRLSWIFMDLKKMAEMHVLFSIFQCYMHFPLAYLCFHNISCIMHSLRVYIDAPPVVVLSLLCSSFVLKIWQISLSVWSNVSVSSNKVHQPVCWTWNTWRRPALVTASDIVAETKDRSVETHNIVCYSDGGTHYPLFASRSEISSCSYSN